MTPITPQQIEAVAAEYCRLRCEQDGIERDASQQCEVARIMWAWLQSFDTVLGPGTVIAR